MTKRASVGVLIVVLLAGAAVLWVEYGQRGLETQDAAVAVGPGYEVPVPPDFAVVTDEEILATTGSKESVVLVRKARTDGQFLATIAIVPVPIAPGDNPTDDAACRASIQGIEEASGATLGRVGMVTVGSNRVCQYALTDEKSSQAATGTVMRAGQRSFAVTCNRDQRDEAVTRACDAVLAGWRVKP